MDMKNRMWSRTQNSELPTIAGEVQHPLELAAARALMKEALALLDEFSLSAAAASLDMAIHQLDREMSPAPPK